MSAKDKSNQGNWQIKRINSKSGPLHGTILSDAIRSVKFVPGETKVLWVAQDEAGFKKFESKMVLMQWQWH